MSFTTLLGKAYAEEFCISSIIRSILLNYDDERIWNTFFKLLGDSCRHMDILTEIAELLGKDRNEFKEDALAGLNIMDVGISEQFVPAVFREALKWEKYAYRFYSHMVRYFSNLEGEIDAEVSRRIREMLLTLIEDEKKHIAMVEELIASHVLLRDKLR